MRSVQKNEKLELELELELAQEVAEAVAAAQGPRCRLAK
jgi:hypothetical protein